MAFTLFLMTRATIKSTKHFYRNGEAITITLTDHQRTSVVLTRAVAPPMMVAG
jgi:hypothetical protein